MVKKCDGILDCPDHSDEKNCPTSASPRCGTGSYECKNGVCIPDSQMCDGRDQCGDATDELLCGQNISLNTLSTFCTVIALIITMKLIYSYGLITLAVSRTGTVTETQTNELYRFV